MPVIDAMRRRGILAIGWAILLLASLLWLVTAYRRLSALLFTVVLILSLASGMWRLERYVLVAWVVFLLSTVSPVDVSFRNVAGPPRVLPIIYGDPTERGMERINRGEAVGGSGFYNPYGPKYLLVW